VSLTAPLRISAVDITDGFDCGDPTLNDWLVRRALANDQAGLSRVFVVTEEGRLVGYYALAAGAVAAREALTKMRRNAPDPIPVVVLGRLARATSHKGLDLGAALFRDAALRVLQAADSIGVRAMLVHALNDRARDFYVHLGLKPSPIQAMTLMVTTEELRRSISKGLSEGRD
jgi:GNAT superfamily N-acetyltransferase